MVMEKVVLVNGSLSRQIFEKITSASKSTSDARKKRILAFEEGLRSFKDKK